MISSSKVVRCCALALAVAGASYSAFAAAKSQGQNNGQPFQAIQNRIDANLALIQANQGDITALQAQSTSLLEAFHSLGTSLSELEVRVSSNETDISSAHARLDGVDGSLASLFSEVSELAARHADDIQLIHQQIDGLSASIADHSAALSDLSAQLVAKAAELSAAIDDGALAVDGLTADLALLNAQTTTLNLQLANAQQTIAALESRASAQEAELDALLLRVMTVEDQVANHSHGTEVDLSGVELSYESENRNVHIFKTPQAAVLANYVDFCESRGLVWWSPKSSADAQLLLDNARAIDNYHTWVQVYGLVTTTGNPATMNGYAFAPDSPSCVAGSSSGWAGVRDWGCSLCDPDGDGYGNTGKSYCWDTSHQYDWFACEEN